MSAAAALQNAASKHRKATASGSELRGKIIDAETELTHVSTLRAAKKETYTSCQIAAALGEGPDPTADDSAEIEELDRKVEVLTAVVNTLRSRIKANDKDIASALADLRSARANYLKATAVASAQEKVNGIFAELHQGFAELMAAHHLAYHKHSDNTYATNAIDLYGPAAHLIMAMRSLTWESYPYDIRPDWIAKHNRWPDETVACQQHGWELEKELAQQEQAA